MAGVANISAIELATRGFKSRRSGIANKRTYTVPFGACAAIA